MSYAISNNSISDHIKGFYEANRSVAIGTLTALVSMPFLKIVNSSVIKVLGKAGKACNKEQDLVTLFKVLGKSSVEPLLKSALKGALVSCAIVIIPVIKETCFRGYLHNKLIKWQQSKLGTSRLNDLSVKVSRIFINGLLFGIFHISPFQGWANVPIFVVTGILGMIFTTLREYTGDAVGCSAAHIAYNTVALAHFFV